jgi:hypothetical protein
MATQQSTLEKHRRIENHYRDFPGGFHPKALAPSSQSTVTGNNDDFLNVPISETNRGTAFRPHPS